MTVTLYHNPRCGKSRQTLEILKQHGIEPHIIDYLKTPPSAAELKTILEKLGIAPRDLLRRKEAAEAGIDPAALTDDALIAAMVANPITIERPIVITPKGAALGRPPEAVEKIL